MQSIQRQEPIPPTDSTPATFRRRTVTGNRFPRKCARGCDFQIPPDPEVRYVVDLDVPKPYSAYLREHPPDYGSYGIGGGDATAEFFFGTFLLLHQSTRPAHEGPAQPEGPILRGPIGSEHL